MDHSEVAAIVISSTRLLTFALKCRLNYSTDTTTAVISKPVNKQQMGEIITQVNSCSVRYLLFAIRDQLMVFNSNV